MTTSSSLKVGVHAVVLEDVRFGGYDPVLKAGDKVLAICGALGADRYLNTIGGRTLYAAAAFAAAGVDLKFIQTRPVTYRQFGQPFVPALSILDVMMFNSPDAVRRMLGEYDLL